MIGQRCYLNSPDDWSARANPNVAGCLNGRRWPAAVFDTVFGGGLPTRVGHQTDWSIHFWTRVHMGGSLLRVYPCQSDRSAFMFLSRQRAVVTPGKESNNLHGVCARARIRLGWLAPVNGLRTTT